MTQTEIEEYITQFPIYQYAFVKPEDIEFNDRVRQICKKECSRYGASWSFALSSDSCQLCDKCTYPRGGCRHLELMHPCIESHGIVVANLIEKNMMDYYLGEHMVIWFSMIFYKES